MGYNTNAAIDLIDYRIVSVESETSVEEACDVSIQHSYIITWFLTGIIAAAR